MSSSDLALGATVVQTASLGVLIWVGVLLTRMRQEAASRQRDLGEKLDGQFAQSLARADQSTATIAASLGDIAQEARQVRQVAAEVAQTFTAAEQSFQTMTHAFQDLATLDDIRERADGMMRQLEEANGRVANQVERTGVVIEQLHALAATWADDGSQLQAAYTKLAAATAEALAWDRAQRERSATALERLLERQASEPHR